MHHRLTQETLEVVQDDRSHADRYRRPYSSLTVRAIGDVATTVDEAHWTPDVASGFGIEVTPAAEDYMHRPIDEAFDWPSIVGEATRATDIEQFYLVVFRSQQKPGADIALLKHYDDQAHQEAKQSAALLYYFAGDTDEHRNALSWCLWTGPQAARDASQRPAHRTATSIADIVYSSFSVNMYNLSLVDGIPNFDPARRR